MGGIVPNSGVLSTDLSLEETSEKKALPKSNLKPLSEKSPKEINRNEVSRKQSNKSAVNESLDAPDIRLISFRDFKRSNSFPSYESHKDMLISLPEIHDRDLSFVVFISHCWLRNEPESDGYDGIPHPDNQSNSKFKLCIDGIKKTLEEYAPGAKECYIWMDYICLQYHNEIHHLDKIMECSDCLFTPLYDTEVW